MSAYELDVDTFRERFAMCPLCLRPNVRLVWLGGVAFDEHPMGVMVVAHPAPIDPGARFNPRATEATYAHARCPMSHAPLMKIEDASTAKTDPPAFDHSKRTTKQELEVLGYCVCEHCTKLPEHEEAR